MRQRLTTKRPHPTDNEKALPTYYRKLRVPICDLQKKAISPPCRLFQCFQYFAPAQEAESFLGSGSITAIPSPASFAIHGSSASHRRSFFSAKPTFCSFPSIKTHHPNPTVPQIPTIPPKNRNIPYWYCPLCTPSLTLPPSSLKYLQKSNPNIHRKCFRCFRCFGCFMFAFGPQNRPILVQIRTNSKTRHPPASVI